MIQHYPVDEYKRRDHTGIEDKQNGCLSIEHWLCHSEVVSILQQKPKFEVLRKGGVKYRRASQQSPEQRRDR